MCAAGALGVDFAALKQEGCLSDFAHVVDARSRASLEQYCAAVERSTGAQIALVTIPSLSGEPVEDVARVLFRSWRIKDKGALLLLSIQDRRSRLVVGRNLGSVDTGVVLGEMSGDLSQERYGPALLRGARAIAARPGHPFPWTAILVTLAIGLAVLGIYWLFNRRRVAADAHGGFDSAGSGGFGSW